MLKFFKKFEKVAITLVMVVLMITFLMSSGYGRGESRRNDPVIAHANGKAIYQSELAESKAEWQCLRDYVQVYDPIMRQQVPIAAGTDFLGPAVYRQVIEQPELFMLLRHEARQAPIQVNGDEYQGYLQNNYHRPATAEDPDAIDAVVHQGLTDLLLIRANFARVADAIKISQPQRQQFLAQAFQQIKLGLVELKAEDFSAKVPAPDARAIQKQFDLFANTPPGIPVEGTNPFGFGYRLPDRVKLQYVEIDRSEAQKAVEATKSAYDWDVAARIYWLQHPSEFPTTQPAATAQMGPSLPATQPAGATASKTRPYEQVKAEALAAVRKPLIDRLMLDVQGQVVSALTADSRSSPTTAPSEGASYSTLHNLAAAVEAQHHVKVFVTDLTHAYHSAKDLANPAVAGAIAEASAGDVSFAQAVMQQAMNFLTPVDKAAAPPRSVLMQPSAPLSDFANNTYIFRIIDAKAAEPAPSVDQVRDQIIADLRTQSGYAAAKEAGVKMLGDARTATLASAAKSAGKTVITTDSFSLMSPDPGAAVALSNLSQRPFLQQSFRLLGSYQPVTSPHPMSLIELPADHRLFVAQLQSLTPDWHGTQYNQDDIEVAQYLRQQVSQELKQQWMSYDSVMQRTGYVPVKSKED